MAGIHGAGNADRWRMGFHLMPPTGWMNDPNGLCQKDGVYHVYHQYRPSWPAENDCCWGHFTSTDLVHWTHHGVAIDRTLPEEMGGVWSGSTTIVDGTMHMFYTANRKYPGDYDYVRTGRTAVQFHTTSEDGFRFTEKVPVISNADSPEGVSLHVRDPKLWWQDGCWHMILGARLLTDHGVVLVYRSDDLDSWSYECMITTDEAFGYMWECPDRIELDGREFLAVCPQGLPSFPDRLQNHDNSGYFALPGRLLDTESIDPGSFHEWDLGFDFYAPQTFTDESGRVVLFGWMGEPAPAWTSVPEGCGFWYCLTVPRVLTLAEDGTILQNPVPELEALRGESVEPVSGASLSEPSEHLEFPGRRADISIRSILGTGSVTIDGGLVFEWEPGLATLRFSDEGIAAGRGEHLCPVDEVRELRILVDDSAAEIYVNAGERVLGTRFFPVDERLSVEVACCRGTLEAWTMGDGMAGTY